MALEIPTSRMVNQKVITTIQRDISSGLYNPWADNKWFVPVEKDLLRIKVQSQRRRVLINILKYIKTLHNQNDIQCIGLINFRIALTYLFEGKPYSYVLKYLKISYQDDFRLEKQRKQLNPKHLHAKDMSAYRLHQIISAMVLYANSKNSSPEISKKLVPLFQDIEIRRSINSTFAKIYDNSLQNSLIGSLSWKPFDKLVGRNKKRVLIEQNYEGALYLCEKVKEIHRKTNLAQYGLATAVVTLCASTVEGLLSNMSYIKRKISRKRPSLGHFVEKYIEIKNPKPYITVKLLFLLSIRNQLHPTNYFNYKINVDMRLALFVMRLTESIIIDLAVSSKKHAYKKWYKT